MCDVAIWLSARHQQLWHLADLHTTVSATYFPKYNGDMTLANDEMVAAAQSLVVQLDEM